MSRAIVFCPGHNAPLQLFTRRSALVCSIFSRKVTRRTDGGTWIKANYNTALAKLSELVGSLSSALSTGFEMGVCVPKSSCEIVMPGGKAMIPTAKNAVTTERESKNLMMNISF